MQDRVWRWASCCSPSGFRPGRAAILVALAAVLAGPPSEVPSWGGDAPASKPLFMYAPGRGLRIGDTGITLGGYANAVVQKPEGKAAWLSLDKVELQIFVDYPSGWHFFSETDVEDAVIVNERGRVTSGDDIVVQERLFLDYEWSDRLTVRAGKFLTPVGIWNLVHAAPLVWTVSRPRAASAAVFDEYTTGLMFYGGTSAREFRIDYSLFAQPTDQLLAEDNEVRNVQRGAGARVQVSRGQWAAGVSSLAQDNQAQQRWEYVAGADFRFEPRYVELWSEIAVNTPVREEYGTEWAFYLQAAVPLGLQFYGIVRYERVNDMNVGVFGPAYRPWPFLVFKAQYTVSDHAADDVPRGFSAAVAYLF